MVFGYFFFKNLSTFYPYCINNLSTSYPHFIHIIKNFGIFHEKTSLFPKKNAIFSFVRGELTAAWYYQNDEATYDVNGNKYGLLYNGYSVEYLNNNREVLMPGWHVPTVDEFNDLAVAVGGARVAGTKLKSTTGWSSGNGTDDFGFTAFPGGARQNGSFNWVGSLCKFWTNSVYSSGRLNFIGFSSSALMETSNSVLETAFYIRLVKDSA